MMTKGTIVSIQIVDTLSNDRDGVSYQVAPTCWLRGQNAMLSAELTMVTGV